ncbi:MAG: FtsX-like permease family protein [Microthrixaceae bacterium]
MVAYLTRIELRRRWRSVALLTVLVALVLGVVLSSVAGSRRSRTAFDRYTDALRAPDAVAFGDPAALAEIGDLEVVEATLPMELPAIFPAASGDAFYPMVASAGGRIPYDYLRLPVVRGRLPGREAPLEVALSERTADRLGVDEGDLLPMSSFTPDAADAVNRGGDAEPDGPSLDFEVVGIVRDPGDIGARQSDITLTFLSPSFRDHHDRDAIGSLAEGTFVVLAPGRTVEELGEATRQLDVELDTGFSADVFESQTNPTMRTIATALLVFAGIAALAGTAVLGTAFAREQQAAGGDDRTLAALGLSRRARWQRVTTPSLLAVVAGVPLGIAVAAIASPLFPIGLARRAEPNPGFHLDGRVLAGGGAVALLAGAAVVSALGAWSVRRSVGAVDAPVRLSQASRMATGAGLPSELVSGLSLAVGTPGKPVRAAVAGTTLGVLGVLAAVVFGASIERLENDHRLYGWGWDAVIEGADQADLGRRAIPAELLADDDLVAVGAVTSQLAVTINGLPEFATATRDVVGHLEPIVVRGSEPLAADEVALGRDTLRRVDAHIGDTVEVSVAGDPRPMLVTGVVTLPVPEDGGSSATGAYFGAAASEGLGVDHRCDDGDSCSRAIGLTLRDGVDPAAIVERYSDASEGVAVSLPIPPGEVERLAAVQDLPRYLGAFLAVLAAAAVSFATATTVRRRRADLAVLRVLGMTSRQLRSSVMALVVALTLGGALLGSALGVVAGRMVWRAVATSQSLPFAPDIPLFAALLVPLASLVLAQIVATVSRQAAGRVPAALTLRTE